MCRQLDLGSLRHVQKIKIVTSQHNAPVGGLEVRVNHLLHDGWEILCLDCSDAKHMVFVMGYASLPVVSMNPHVEPPMEKS